MQECDLIYTALGKDGGLYTGYYVCRKEFDEKTCSIAKHHYLLEEELTPHSAYQPYTVVWHEIFFETLKRGTKK